jgi:ParB family chromosome partitioning protein
MQHDLKKKSRLGKGLSSLMGMNASGEVGPYDPSALPAHASIPTHPVPPTVEASVPRGTPLDVEIARIDPNPHQPRRHFAEASLNELADSIRSNGVIQPVVLTPAGDRFELIAGERRLRASQLAGLATIPAYIRDADQLLQAQMALVENIQREDLNPMDRATGYRTLLANLGVNQTELAARLGEDRVTIANHLRLLDLQDGVQDLVRAGTLSLGHAKVLAGISDPDRQIHLASRVVEEHLSVRALEKLLAEPQADVAPATETPKASPSAHLKDLELNLSKQLGLRVQVRPGATKSKGKVILHYSNLDEFDQLVARMGVKLDD